ncbi:hypothetical protein [Pseudophaeobacter sp. C1-32P7]|uniref:hypothetical protein n=1 Tax=Pseudophaeobacter sp. C1-32P7 TaxID=3098142 RepID=UPI0034D3DC2C
MLELILSILMCEEPPDFQSVVEVGMREHVFMNDSATLHLGGSDGCFVIPEDESIKAAGVEVVGVCGWDDEPRVDLYVAASFEDAQAKLEGYPNVEVKALNKLRVRVSCRPNSMNGYFLKRDTG